MPSGTLRNLNDEINTRILVKTDTTGESAWIHLFFYRIAVHSWRAFAALAGTRD